jgi:hypothetical protein
MRKRNRVVCLLLSCRDCGMRVGYSLISLGKRLRCTSISLRTHTWNYTYRRKKY